MITRKSILCLTAILALTACETVEGIGKDVSGAARAVKRAL
ncbi:entericidin, EcnA/B family [uncultured Litoreibacter sp.]|nr:entericidin, EcnA/B family [uncultured Litoreibacter sp.]